MIRIVDPNLRLILLQAAWNEGLIPAFDKKAFFREKLGEEFNDQAAYNYRLDTRVRDALLAIPLLDEMLAKIKLVEGDAGNPVFREIWTYWDGESEEFDINDLSGIEACTGLESLFFTSAARFRDCSPLARLPNLIEFKNYTVPLSDLRPLLSIPKLAELDVRYDSTPENRAVVAALKARGVNVTES